MGNLQSEYTKMRATTARQQDGDVQAVLLVGGLGTRLRSIVPSAPKPLALVGERAFLELLVRQLQCQGIRRLVMCTGYRGDQIESVFGCGKDWGVAITYSKEHSALGTAGALKLAQPFVEDAAEFLVMNGDSFLEVDFHKLLHFHRQHEGVMTMAVQQVENAARFGTVQMDADGRVLAFAEKTGDEAPGIVNGGVYVFDRSMLEHIPTGPASLEREVFPTVLSRGIFAMQQQGMFIDIGTPEDYARAQGLENRLYETALRGQ